MLQRRFQAHRTVRASPLVHLRSAESLGNPVSPTGGDVISKHECVHLLSLSLSLSLSLTHSLTQIHTYIHTYRHT